MIATVQTDHHHLHVHGSSPVHRLVPHAKLIGLASFVGIVALTPRRWVEVFVVDAAVAAAVVVTARLPLRLVAARLAVITPFVAFAILLPVIGDDEGERVVVAGLDLSVDGLWAMGNIIAKAGLGATAGIVVTATTPVPQILTGLGRLRVPPPIVAIIAFMVRYLDLIVDELGRMRRAMIARGYDPRWVWQARPIATSAGSLFVRTYERGERIHRAMLARGYTGTTADADPAPTTRSGLALALVPAALAAAALVVAGVLR